MANEFINVYKNNPTVGLTDGTAVSTDGSFTSPVEITLDASQNESKKQKLAIRTEPGYVTTGTVTLSDKNDTNDRWKLSWTENGTYADSISTANAIDSVNTIFYAQASSSSLESPQIDRSAKIKAHCVIAAV